MIKVLDASALIHDYNPIIEDGEHYTTNGIIQEVESKKDVVALALEYGKLKVREPLNESVEKVRETAVKTGDTISIRDIEVLALTMDLGGTLYTDDYGIQNVAKKLRIPTKPVITEGIKGKFVWRKICKGCKKMYLIDHDEDICEVCGSVLERKMVKNRLNNVKNNKGKKKGKR
ncbi:MAG: endoribonuclease Nob1 [Methanothermococcus sp.]|jgi:UPF0271 protein|uniref:type II toxin-antitoxin system VapC family toxin n=1 Tax=Methanothermococcus TaxID=155862 RepID=UPI00035EDCE0|nr:MULTISPECIES: type II toxin-antitoxin system VapC family toxin [Methanothermococcus]MDK2790994.1 endoribonuclease Nob1 [Methanothermococcus sp.]MDK2988213.1 endoribonuclease Nob1 [Methanothermococcus sp.]